MDFSDERWGGLLGGYRLPCDPRKALRAIEDGQNVEAAWSELWEELHHQGDVDLASYAAVPHLARLAAAGKAGGRNAYALAATIEQSRGHDRNPPLSDWLASGYTQAWTTLFSSALDTLRTADDPDVVSSALAVVAIHRRMPVLGRMASDFSEAERLAILIDAGWEDPSG
ncbi:hypothetical protein DMC25_23355 [Caulobacter sp. D4A]|uniref:hypothetical protein n=1 Tax=unclassified Caulobacter TaxID=2648921 RepID=UPI000D73FA02|nr:MULTISPECIES: hypothetical protein [unclassified Caulobacter]PXA77326.1 hypothetical protein DMC25_23355 [Caulobacter sp. D4A]PXA91649.1 hypothetical protein DMC18_12740 [Caulobacter sp. D5]